MKFVVLKGLANKKEHVLNFHSRMSHFSKKVQIFNNLFSITVTTPQDNFDPDRVSTVTITELTERILIITTIFYMKSNVFVSVQSPSVAIRVG